MTVNILMCFYRRPNMVCNAFKSLKNQTSNNWNLCLVEDDEPHQNFNVLSVLSEYLPDKKVHYTLTGDSEQTKEERGYSRFGKYWNDYLLSNSTPDDLAIMLCDDDALYPDYVENLINWFSVNEDKNYVFSHINPFDPFSQEIEDAVLPPAHCLNLTGDIFPACRVDASQVAWRVKPMIDANIRFPENQTKNLDASLYTQMHSAWGDCSFSGVVGQYKGVYPDNLTSRLNQYSPIDLPKKSKC